MCAYGIGSQTLRYIGNTEGDLRYQPVGQHEVPKEVSNLNNKVLYKSPKGSKVEINDNEGEECISISDQCGQVLKLKSPMKGSYSKNNGHLDDKTMADREFKGFQGLSDNSELLFRSLNGSQLRIESGESSTVLNLDAKGLKNSKLTLQAGSSPSARIDVDSVSVVVDTNVTITVGSCVLTVSGNQVSIKGNTVIQGNVSVNGDVNVNGNVHSTGEMFGDGPSDNHHSH